MDYAVNVQKISLDLFMDMFVASGYAENFEHGNPSVIAGHSGAELVLDIYNKVGILLPVKPNPKEYSYSMEYWYGFLMAYFQWMTGAPFERIFQVLPASEMLSLYPALHEVSDDKAVDVLLSRIRNKRQSTSLKRIRLDRGLTQKELATEACMNLRTLQEYESGAKSINKASVSTVYALSRILCCRITELLEFF